MKTEEKGTISSINERFIWMDKKPIDSKNRVTLGGKILKLITAQTGTVTAGFQIFLSKEGDILLRPMVSIPTREAWIYQNSEVLKLIRRGLAEAKQGKVKKVEDLDKFLEDL